MRVTLALAFFIASPALAADVRLALVVGANHGLAGENPLRYAEDDARRFRDVLIELGETAPERALLVLGRKENLVAALRELHGRADELKKNGQRVIVTFYFSGHGDEEALHLRGETFSLGELHDALRTLGANVVLSFIDACRNFSAEKGVSEAPAFSLAPLFEKQKGTLEFRASSAGEAAQESDELRGAVFTHYLITGLRGAADANRDGRVSAAELYAYVYGRTLLRTSGERVAQHPSLDANMTGTGEVMLGFPDKAQAEIALVDPAQRYVVFSLPNAGVMGELFGPGTLALPEGRYFISRRADGKSAATEIDLSLGGKRLVSASDFHRVSEDELSARGGAIELRPLRFGAAVGVEEIVAAAERPALRIEISLGYSLAEWEVGGVLGFSWATLATPTFSGDGEFLDLGAYARRRWFVHSLTLSVVAQIEARAGYETLAYDFPKGETADGWRPEERALYPAFAARLGGALSVPLGHHWSFEAEAAPGFLLRNETQSSGAQIIAAHFVAWLVCGGAFHF